MELQNERNYQKQATVDNLLERMTEFEKRIEKIERKENCINSNAYTPSNINFKNKTAATNIITATNKWLESTCESVFKPRETRHKNLVLFGVKNTTVQNLQNVNTLEKFEVIKIFNSIGITVESDSVEVQRLKPKRDQPEPYPILVKLLPGNKNLRVSEILKVAKSLKDSIEYKHVSISPDLYVEQRIIGKKLVEMRKELNKELSERIPNATFYFSIHNGKIVKRSKFREASEKCKEVVSNLIKEAIDELKPQQALTPASIFSMPLLNQILTAKNNENESLRIRKLSEKISAQAISTINERRYWSEIDQLNDQSTQERLRRLERSRLEQYKCILDNQTRMEKVVTMVDKVVDLIEGKSMRLSSLIDENYKQLSSLILFTANTMGAELKRLGNISVTT